MSDRIVRAITSDGLVQAAAISSRDLTERARQILCRWPRRLWAVLWLAAL